MMLWEGEHLTKTERVIIICSVLAFIISLVFVLFLTIRSILGGPTFDFENIAFVMLFIIPGFIVKQKANRRLLIKPDEITLNNPQVNIAKKENESIAYAFSSIKGSWIIILSIFIIGILFFTLFLFR